MWDVDFWLTWVSPSPPVPCPHSCACLGQRATLLQGARGGGNRGGGCGWKARSSPHCADISENLPGLPQCEATLGVLYQELERTWPVAGSRENGCREEFMMPVFFLSTEGQFLMTGAEVRNAKL